MAVLAALLVLCVRSTPSDRRLPQDAYVWQRDWTPSLIRAIGETAPLVAGFRILLCEWSPDGRVVRPAVDWAALDRAGRLLAAQLGE